MAYQWHINGSDEQLSISYGGKGEQNLLSGSELFLIFKLDFLGIVLLSEDGVVFQYWLRT